MPSSTTALADTAGAGRLLGEWFAEAYAVAFPAQALLAARIMAMITNVNL